jgi:hypothetical protein
VGGLRTGGGNEDTGVFAVEASGSPLLARLVLNVEIRSQ